jgi:hypothetical protein
MIAAAVMARIERRKISDYGLSLRLALRKNFWLGALLGFVSISGARWQSSPCMASASPAWRFTAPQS